MPYKERLKKNPEKKPNKNKYKVINISEYNESLKKRGKISLYLPAGDLKEVFINENSYSYGVSGRSQYYSEEYIIFIYTIYRLFGWGMRQTIGYLEDMWEAKELDIAVPSFGHLSDLFAKMTINVRHYCNNAVKKASDGEKVDLIADSTGMKFDKAGDWYEEKYGKRSKKRPWRKIHISINSNNMEIEVIKTTENNVGDTEVCEDLIPNNINVEKLIADGGYYSIELLEKLCAQDILPVIPPPCHAVVHGEEWSEWHDKIVQYIKDKKTVYAYYNKYGYNVRSRVEVQFSRIKRCIGEAFKTQKLESQQTEGIIIANIINLWNSFGRPTSVKV